MKTTSLILVAAAALLLGGSSSSAAAATPKAQRKIDASAPGGANNPLPFSSVAKAMGSMSVDDFGTATAGYNIAGQPTVLSSFGASVQSAVNAYQQIEGGNANFFSTALANAPADLARMYRGALQGNDQDTQALARAQIDASFLNNYPSIAGLLGR